ncbi:hypothetical protein [Sphingomonas nostoxanthinifaciens]|uniref:hypothetical protein n=1 Tax=Sphingomonas nostoxanthinifaciens TaxID=2872652 RepID=UPI001CC1E191|nr:hypothetical protein [Sphingomonas nostoxanthinifaciens]UAK26174.1 hypothetical protein K8P63_08780 [Sphingomonas nostoxanthinifaciens]
MVHATAAIGDFMLILISSALWVGGGLVGAGLLGLGALGGLAFAFRRWWRVR